MDDDIKFYTLDFELLYILPPYVDKSGYSAVNVTIEMNGVGKLEITFRDDELKAKIKKNRDNIMVVWRDFQGYVKSYMFTEETNKLFGEHLNGLLKRAVIPTVETYSYTYKAGYILYNNVLDSVSWLTRDENLSSCGENIKYSAEKYMTCDKVVQEINTAANGGYRIYADIPNEKYIYYYIERAENNLMLSVENLNIYEPEITYENADMATVGWYEYKLNDTTKWQSVTSDSSKTDIHKIETVLSTNDEDEAKKELSKRVSVFKLTAKTRSLMHGVDYNIGDIIRIQIDGVTEKLLVSGVNMWNEKSYGEEPILTEI